MVNPSRWALALATCGVWGCAAISGLEGLDVVADVDGAVLDATTPDVGASDATTDITSEVGSKDAGTDTLVLPDASDSGCFGGGTPCKNDKSGCCSSTETCGSQGCCKGIGTSCGNSFDCCSGSVCTAGGTCQTSCTPLDAGCQTGSQDKCCRGQAICSQQTARCSSCQANDAGCSNDQQCCSNNCSSNSNVCRP
jgi:hypothetical protein